MQGLARFPGRTLQCSLSFLKPPQIDIRLSFKENNMAMHWPSAGARGDKADLPDYGSYDSNHLLDSILDELHLPDDAALCEALDVDESVISDLREMRREVDAALLIRMHELTDISIAGLRNILGDRRRKARFAEGGGEDPH
jgi:hypothetical protein